MKVKLLEKQVTEWVKHISIEREGESYRVDLRWDTHNGYDIICFYQGFTLIPTPEWAHVPEFEYELDSATEKEGNK